LLDGAAFSCSQVRSLLNNGSAVQCPHNDCGPQVFRQRGEDGIYRNVLSSPFRAYADGTSGYRVPVWQRNSFTFDNQTSSFGSQIIGWTFKAVASNNAELGGDDKYITLPTDKPSTTFIPRTLDDGDCRFLMNELFGSQNSVMAGYYNPPTVYDSNGKLYGEGYKNGEISNPFTGEPTELATHIYGGSQGTTLNVPIYIPANPDGSAPKPLPSYRGEDQSRTKIATYISGERTESGGGISSSNIFQLSNGLVIVANHIGGFDKNYQKKGERNRQGSFRVGYIGGPGGNSGTGYFIHTHISFFRNGKRVDPRGEFCSGNYRLK
jgi:hypothetical protein